MVAVKPQDVDAFVARPDPARPVVLVFGPDSGLIGERVNALIKASVDDPNDPFALARLEGEDLTAEPSRLLDEAQTMPLFGGRRTVWVKAAGRNIAQAVEALLLNPDGKLILLEGVNDAVDPLRDKHLNDVRKRIDEVRTGKAAGPGSKGPGFSDG